MITEQQQSDLGSLSRQWFERVKDIREKARIDSLRPDTDHSIEGAALDGIDISKILPDSDLFAEPVYKEFQPQQVFAGDVDTDLFRPPEISKSVETSQSLKSAVPDSSTPTYPNTMPKNEVKNSTLLHKVVAASLVLIALVLLYAAIRLPGLRLAGLLPESSTQIVQNPQLAPVTNLDSMDTVDNEPPATLQMADDEYLRGNYEQAAVAYKKLLGKMTLVAKDDMLNDFLRLRMALSLKETDNVDEAIRQMEIASLSSSPVIKMLSNYYTGWLEMSQRQYLKSRRRAYQALALIDSIDQDQPWVQELKRNCRFLIGASISHEVLTISDADKNIPGKLWNIQNFEEDPFAGLDEDQVRTLLMIGTERLNRALLGPRFEADTSGNIRQWLITSDGASIDELMNRFAANAEYDVFWTPASNKAGIRQRPVWLHLPESSDEQVVSIIAGCAGLLAIADQNSLVTIHNPIEYDYASDQIQLLGGEAVSLWRQFLLGFHEDRYLPNVHFALGLLYTQQELVVEAMAEYKIVANRFSQSSLAPMALYNSGQLKSKIRDYDNAYRDLKQLVEQYPDSPITAQGYLSLAQITAQTGSQAEGAKLYRKIYYLNASSDSQADAALAAGEIYYKMDNYGDAKKWLTQYIDLKKDQTTDKQLYHAYYMLGKTRLALDETQAGCAVLQKAIRGHLPKQERVDAISAFVEGCIQLREYIQAYDVLEDTYLSQFSQEESVRLMVLKSRVLRGMGLAEKAIALLEERQDYVIDPMLKTTMGYELSECYIEQGQLELAFKKLVQNLEEAPAGTIAHRTGIRLAEVCMQLGRHEQAVSICNELLKQEPADDLRQKAMHIQATIHQQHDNYENAALALIGQVQ